MTNLYVWELKDWNEILTLLQKSNQPGESTWSKYSLMHDLGFGCFLLKVFANITLLLHSNLGQEIWNSKSIFSESGSPEDPGADAKAKSVSYLHIVIFA